MDLRRADSVARDVVTVVREHDVTFMAGSIAHAALLSILPLLLLLVLIVGAVGNEYLTEQISAMAREHLTPAGEGLLFEALTQATDRAGASLIGVTSLLWGMLYIFRGVNTAFGELYGGDGDGRSSVLETVFDGIIVFTVILIATVGAGFVTATLGRIDRAIVRALTPFALFFGLAVAFFPIYYLFPDPDVTVREVLPGTAVAAAGWVLLEALFGVYVSLVDTIGTYETFGAVILLLIWLYGNAFVLLVGAAVNVVIGGHHTATNDDPDHDGDGRDSTDAVRA